MRLVIDTNIALDLLVFDDPDRASLAASLATGEAQWIATAAMRDELERVLGYPLIASRLLAGGRAAAQVLADFDRRTRRIDAAPPRAPCVCSDPDDQIFVDLAVARRRAAAQQGPRGACDAQAAGGAGCRRREQLGCGFNTSRSS